MHTYQLYRKVRNKETIRTRITLIEIIHHADLKTQCLVQGDNTVLQDLEQGQVRSTLIVGVLQYVRRLNNSYKIEVISAGTKHTCRLHFSDYGIQTLTIQSSPPEGRYSVRDRHKLICRQ